VASNTDFRTLLLQFISGEISGEDKALFYDMILDEGKEEEFKNVLKELGEEREELYSKYEYKTSDWEQMKQRILRTAAVVETDQFNLNAEKAILLNERTISEKFVRRMPVRRLNWAAAAAIVVGITIGTYFLIRQRTNSQGIETTIAKADIAPGGNRATLTLGNGAAMILDSEAIGTLAQQGNTKISKTDSGRLAYTVENNKTSNKATIEENILTTPRGGQYQLELADGTKVWLNAASSITYPAAFEGKQRFVKVTGEVYFEVVHNSNMPFVVKAGNQVITDLGTSFNINAYPDEGALTTTLLQGSIKIFVGTKTNLLVPGQQEIASVEGESVMIKNNADIDKVMAWRNGKMALTDVSVKQLMTEISRWYDVDIEYVGTVPNKQFYGSIHRDVPLSTVLNALKAYGVETKVERKKIIVQ
jgi:transmembrane sensor